MAITSSITLFKWNKTTLELPHLKKTPATNYTNILDFVEITIFASLLSKFVFEMTPDSLEPI